MQIELDGNSSENFDISKEFSLIAQEIKNEWVKNRRKDLSFQIDQAEKEGRKEDLNSLIQEFQSIH
jgi:hypothetical protein